MTKKMLRTTTSITWVCTKKMLHCCECQDSALTLREGTPAVQQAPQPLRSAENAIQVCESLGWQKDEALLKEMEEKNKEDLNKIADKITDAKENLGDSEVCS